MVCLRRVRASAGTNRNGGRTGERRAHAVGPAHVARCRPTPVTGPHDHRGKLRTRQRCKPNTRCRLRACIRCAPHEARSLAGSLACTDRPANAALCARATCEHWDAVCHPHTSRFGDAVGAQQSTRPIPRVRPHGQVPVASVRLAPMRPPHVRGRVRSIQAACCRKDKPRFNGHTGPMRNATSARQCTQSCGICVRRAPCASLRPIAHGWGGRLATLGCAPPVSAISYGNIRPSKGANRKRGVPRLGRAHRR